MSLAVVRATLRRVCVPQAVGRRRLALLLLEEERSCALQVGCMGRMGTWGTWGNMGRMGHGGRLQHGPRETLVGTWFL